VLDTPASEFPPGPFTDGHQYHMSDLKGKVVVLYFFETDPRCKNCRTIIPKRAAVVQAFQGKPVKFLGVAANVPLARAAAFQTQTGLPMPVYADSLGILQKRYGFKISLENIWAMLVIGADGKVKAGDMDTETIDRALKSTDAKFKHNFDDYDKRLRPALDLLEYGHYTAAVKALSPLAKVGGKAQDGAKKLIAEVKADAQAWKTEADDAAAADPLKAYDLYQKVATTLPTDELGKGSAAAAKKLAADKSVAHEIAARKAFTALGQMMGQVTPAGQGAVLTECKSIMKKYPGTPTAEKVDVLYRELGGQDAGGKEPAGKSGKKAG
jgi:peroxiredoxin